MDVFEFAAMIEETPIRTRVIEYHDTTSNELAAVCLTDVLDDGVSMVYSFYQPDRPGDSLGTYIILDHIRIAREAGLPYVYLGYWVPGSAQDGLQGQVFGAEVCMWAANGRRCATRPTIPPRCTRSRPIRLPNRSPISPCPVRFPRVRDAAARAAPSSLYLIDVRPCSRPVPRAGRGHAPDFAAHNSFPDVSSPENVIKIQK